MNLGLVLGVDPGESGAYAFVTPDGIVLEVGDIHGKHRKYKMPGKDKCSLLLAAIERLKPFGISHAVVEKGGTRPKNSRGRVLKQGVNAGQVLGIPQGAGIPTSEVSSSSWKAQLGIPSDPDYGERKRIARAFAEVTFNRKFKRADHAEAALLALWWIRATEARKA